MGGFLLGPFGRYELGTARVTIGRQPSNSIVLHAAQVSGQHAEVRPEGGGYGLVDLGSTNGTLLNGLPIPAHTPQPLHNGDVISIGGIAISVELALAELPPTIHANAPAQIALPPTQRIAAPPAVPEAGCAPVHALPPAPHYRVPGAPLAPGYPPSYVGAPVVAKAPPARQGSATKRILLIVGGTLTLVLIACISLGVIVLRYIYNHTPEGVVNAYYSAIQDQHYTDAYQYMDTFNQQLFTAEAQNNNLADGSQLFALVFSCLDKQFGTINGFSVELLKQDSRTATVQVAVTRPREQYGDTIGLIQEQGNWKIALFELPPGQQCIDITPGQ